jgi:adenine-specific DNA-methyltransferase
VPELQFRGKEFVYNHHLTVPFRPLEMHAEKSLGDARLDGNLIVHGDNLHALKALLPMYAGKVDCIFIDPPYNTGNEGWAYNDNVNSPMIREWLSDNPIGLDDGLRHDKWACMMWPRLKLLHELLAENGSLWVTIDDNEDHRLRMTLDEVFGPEGYITEIAWQHSDSSSNNVTQFSQDFNSIFVYSRNPYWCPNFLDDPDKRKHFRNPDNDPNGPWYDGADIQNPAIRPNLQFDIDGPNGIVKHPPNGWRWSRDTMEEKFSTGELRFSTDGKRVIRRTYLKDQKGLPPSSLWGDVTKTGHTRGAKNTLKHVFGSDYASDLFATPKPVPLIGYILALATDEQSLVLDSFAGSGTTAHAVLAANARDGGKRRFILVEGEDYADTLTAERVRRVITGYAFTGTQREELLREPLTFAKLRNAATLLEKVQAIETLDGPKFDRIAKTVRDGALIVTGERDVAETTPGMGGAFTYCTLGEPIEMDAILSGAALPDQVAMAGLLWHTATATPLPADAMTAAPDIGEGVARLGEFVGRTYWLIYRPDLDWLKSADAALSLTKSRAVAATAPGNHLVFAPAKFVSRELLARERIDVDYAPLPFALYRLETA